MPESLSKQATLRDVAELAGVSYQTVWRVVKDQPHVAEETRRRVLQAVEQLDYHPHRPAQMLTTGRSHILHLIFFEGGSDEALLSILHLGTALWVYPCCDCIERHNIVRLGPVCLARDLADD
jgi:hypothetical protein